MISKRATIRRERSISFFAGFLENENYLETFIVIFENVSPTFSF